MGTSRGRSFALACGPVCEQIAPRAGLPESASKYKSTKKKKKASLTDLDDPEVPPGDGLLRERVDPGGARVGAVDLVQLPGQGVVVVVPVQLELGRGAVRAERRQEQQEEEEEERGGGRGRRADGGCGGCYYMYSRLHSIASRPIIRGQSEANLSCKC